jgi:hypothetical protein
VPAIDAGNLLVAAVDGKLVELLGGYAIHTLKVIRFDAAEAGAVLINLAFSAAMVKMDAPAILPY